MLIVSGRRDAVKSLHRLLQFSDSYVFRIPAPTKKFVLVETAEFVGPPCIGWRSHVYSFRVTAFLWICFLPHSGSSASGHPCPAPSALGAADLQRRASRSFARS